MEAEQQSLWRINEGFAGFGRRAIALLLDWSLLWALFWIVGFERGNEKLFGLFSLEGGVLHIYPVFSIGKNWPQSIEFAVLFLYFAIMESSSLQATIGKYALGIKVTDIYGRRITMLRAANRFFAKIASTIIFMLGFMLAIFTMRKQTLHDLLCSTLVLKGA